MTRSQFEAELKVAKEEAAASRTSDRRWKLILTLLALLLCVAVGVAWWLVMDNARLATANAQYGQEQAQEKQTIAKEAQKALCGTKDSEIYDKAICEKLADAAEEPPPPPVEPPVAAGPSQEELVKAFREYCAQGNNCKGRDGAAPTADDIAAAFVRFCADGRCTGPAGKDAPPAVDGKDGAPGENGADGVDGASLPPSGEMVLAAVTTYCSTTGACVGPAGADGAAGPPPTAEVVLAAVKQVCADNACVGPMGPAGTAGVPGEKGDKGDTGEPGRGIQSQFCGDDRRYLITYTDGTTADGGVCRESPIPGVGP